MCDFRFKPGEIVVWLRVQKETDADGRLVVRRVPRRVEVVAVGDDGSWVRVRDADGDHIIDMTYLEMDDGHKVS